MGMFWMLGMGEAHDKRLLMVVACQWCNWVMWSWPALLPFHLYTGIGSALVGVTVENGI